MVTDVLSTGRDLLIAGARRKSRALGAEARDGEIALPGVMSRKKQVAPKLLALL
jgi:manganese-dependent inorganic pyrophosphatase